MAINPIPQPDPERKGSDDTTLVDRILDAWNERFTDHSSKVSRAIVERYAKPSPARLDTLIVPPGSTLVLRSKVKMSAENFDRLREQVELLQKQNPGCSIVILDEPGWDVAVIGVKP